MSKNLNSRPGDVWDDRRGWVTPSSDRIAELLAELAEMRRQRDRAVDLMATQRWDYGAYGTTLDEECAAILKHLEGGE